MTDMEFDGSESWDGALADLEKRRAASRAMGGEERLAKHRGSGKLDARARIDHLLDPGSFLELGTLVGGDENPADAIVMGSGRVDGRPVMVAAEDFTVKAGTISSYANSKRYRVAELAVEDKVPCIMMLEGAGFRADGMSPGRTPTDLHLPGQVLGPGPAGHRGARLLGRARGARRARSPTSPSWARSAPSSPPVRRSCTSRWASRSPRRTSAARRSPWPAA